MEMIQKESSYLDLTQASIQDVLNQIEALMEASNDLFPHDHAVQTLKRFLQTLHARFRQRHAAGILDSTWPGDPSFDKPQTYSRATRLEQERGGMLGMLDRVISQCDALISLSAPEQYVFALRIHELLAVFRRHLAEEDCIVYQTEWLDVGGEG